VIGKGKPPPRCIRGSSKVGGCPAGLEVVHLSLPYLPTAPVTLDATSAHPDLTLSKDLKTVTLDHVPRGDCSEPTEPERFYPFCCLLGLPGLSSGRQAWEAELQGPLGGACVVGVVSELVPRRGYLPLELLSGFWALHLWLHASGPH
jgi:tripartite motif-containing protein 31